MVTALALLAAITALLGTVLTHWMNLSVLQVVVGSLLLVFGLQWLRKAILRSSGYKALNNEELLFQVETNRAKAAPMLRRSNLDWFAFMVAFKGMLLEGLEVIFIVITIGASSGRLGVATASAVGAAVIVGGAGVVLHRPLAQVPENTLKFAVGLLLSTFGTFWAGEGVGVHWLGSDLALLWLLAAYGLASWAAVRYLATAKCPAPHVIDEVVE